MYHKLLLLLSSRFLSKLGNFDDIPFSPHLVTMGSATGADPLALSLYLPDWYFTIVDQKADFAGVILKFNVQEEITAKENLICKFDRPVISYNPFLNGETATPDNIDRAIFWIRDIPSDAYQILRILWLLIKGRGAILVVGDQTTIDLTIELLTNAGTNIYAQEAKGLYEYMIPEPRTAMSVLKFQREFYKECKFNHDDLHQDNSPKREKIHGLILIEQYIDWMYEEWLKGEAPADSKYDEFIGGVHKFIAESFEDALLAAMHIAYSEGIKSAPSSPHIQLKLGGRLAKFVPLFKEEDIQGVGARGRGTHLVVDQKYYRAVTGDTLHKQDKLIAVLTMQEHCRPLSEILPLSMIEGVLKRPIPKVGPQNNDGVSRADNEQFRREKITCEKLTKIRDAIPSDSTDDDDGDDDPADDDNDDDDDGRDRATSSKRARVSKNQKRGASHSKSDTSNFKRIKSKLNISSNSSKSSSSRK